MNNLQCSFVGLLLVFVVVSDGTNVLGQDVGGGPKLKDNEAASQRPAREIVALFVQAKDKLDKQITDREEEYRKFLSNAPLLSPNAQKIHDNRLIQIEAARVDLTIESVKLEAKLETLEQAIDKGDAPRELATLIRRIEAPSLRAKAGNGGRPRLADKEFLSIYVNSLRKQLELNEKTRQKLDSLLDKERNADKELASWNVRQESFRSEILRKSRLFDVVLERLEEIKLTE